MRSSLMKRALGICCILLVFYQGSSRAQIISANGAVISISGGTVVGADTLHVDNTSVLVNDGIFNFYTLINGGITQGQGIYNIGRDFINNGTFTQGTGLITFNGTGFSQLIGGSSVTTFNSVTIDNANGIKLNSSPVINTALSFVNGKIITGANVLSLGTAATVSGAGAGKYLFGNLKRSFSAANNLAAAFDIGDAANYTPVNLSSVNVSVAGALAVSTVPGNHPNSSASGIDTVKNVNRYWNLVPEGGLTAVYNAAFNYPATDVDAGVTVSSMIVKKYSSNAWSAVTLRGAPTTTSAAISGETGFGVFAIGEISGTSRAITAFTFPVSTSTTINETSKTIAVTVPFGTDVTALAAAFSTTGASVKVGTTVQSSGTTPNNFSSPVTYTVYAVNASTQNYLVTVNIAPNPAKAITAFTFPVSTGTTINETSKTIAVTVPFGTDVTALAAAFSTTGTSVKVGATVQSSGITANNFSSPVTYTVVAADTTTQKYVVTVTVSPNTAPPQTPVFSVASGTVTFGTAVTLSSAGSEKIYYTTNGADPTASSTLYTGPVVINSEFTLKAVAVKTGAPNSAISSALYTQAESADLVSLTLSGSPSNYTFAPGAYIYPKINTAYGVSGITVTPAGAGTLTVNGVTVNSGSASGILPLTAGVEKTITVSATEAGKKMKTYTLKITSPPGSAKAITAFQIMGNGTVNETDYTIAVNLPYGTSLTSLTPTISITGASVNPNTGVPRDFTNPVQYTVTAQDATTQVYTVTVTLKQVASGGNITLNNTIPDALVISPTQELIVNVTVTDQVTKPSLDYGSMIVNGTGTIPKTTINSDIAQVAIPPSTKVTASDPLWNGVMLMPVATTAVLPITPGETKTVSRAIEIGSSRASMSFSNAIRILMRGEAGKKVGYIPAGGVFKELTTTGTADSQAAGNALPAGGSFKIDVGTDLVIWTRHFTRFITYTQIINTGPVANNDVITLPEDGQVTYLVTNNDSAADGIDLTSIGVASGPAHGSLTVGTNGTITYKPVQDYFGKDTLTYTIKDKKGRISAAATVSITVLSVNDAPVAIDDIITATQDNAVIISVLSNDYDVDGTINPSTITITNSTANGSLSINTDGTVTYTPNVNFNGSDAFSYTVKDNIGSGSNIATATITVNKVIMTLLGGKIANDQSVCNNSVPSPFIQVTAASGDDGNYSYQWQRSVSGAGSGFTDIPGAVNINYTPGALTQTTWFRRVVNSTTSPAFAESNVIKITVAPAIMNKILPYAGLTAYCGTGDPDKIAGGIPTGGESTVYTYQWQSSTDNINFSNIPGAGAKDYDPGVISVSTYFRRRVTSGTCSAVSSNTVLITIQPALINNVISANQNIAPGSVPQALTGLLPSGGNGGIAYLWESSNTDNNGFAPAPGTNNNMNYLPSALTKTTLFRRKIISGTCENYSNIIRVTVIRSNSVPVVLADDFTAVINIPLIIAAPGLLNNDSDPDKDPLSASLASQPANGTVAVNANGSFIYTPNFNFTGTDSFNYQACDNGSPQLCQTGTVTIRVSGQPVIGVAKAVSVPVLQPDGSYNLTYTLTVSNLGATDLTQVQVTDDLSKTFPAPVKYKITGPPVGTGGGISGNSSFNGSTDKNLLVSNSALLAGATGNINFTLNIELAGGSGTYFNSATATGTGNNITVTDVSASGNDPDPNHNGNPGDISESDATPVILQGNALIGLAKQAGTPVKQPDKSNLVTYTITVKNMGNVPLQNVQVFDDLIKTFPAPLHFAVDGSKITAGVLKPNSSYNGIGDDKLLAPANSLAVGQSDTIHFTVKVIPDPAHYGPFNNIAIGNAQSPSGVQVSDISTVGKNPDPDKDGKPDEKEPTPVTLEKSTIRVAEGFSPNGDGVNDGFVIENLDGAPISLEIYNRWGNVVFRDNDYKNPWNGICNQGIYAGTHIADGTYFYVVIKHTGADKYIGSITINR